MLIFDECTRSQTNVHDKNIKATHTYQTSIVFILTDCFTEVRTSGATHVLMTQIL